MSLKRNSLMQLIISAVCLALCMVLPFLTGQIPQIGSALSPMHLPVLLCGFLCGPVYALAVGAAAPQLRFALFGMPPIFPTGVAMCFELAAYGVISSLMYRRLPRKKLSIYAALLIAMVGGRIVWGLVRWLIAGLAGSSFTFTMFLSGALLKAVPGIIVQIVLIPLLVMAIERAFPKLTQR